jgi:bacterioferritin-associated ferredoxin
MAHYSRGGLHRRIVMILCVRNRLRESTCTELADTGACQTVGSLYRLQNVRMRCGRCVPAMRELFECHAAVVVPPAARSGPPVPTPG